MTSVLSGRPGFSGIFHVNVAFPGIEALPKVVVFPMGGFVGASADILVSSEAQGGPVLGY